MLFTFSSRTSTFKKLNTFLILRVRVHTSKSSELGPAFRPWPLQLAPLRPWHGLPVATSTRRA